MSQIERLEDIDLTNHTSVSETLSDIAENYNFDVEIYDGRGNIKYTTHGTQMMDFLITGRFDFVMLHEELTTVKSQKMSDGITYEEAVRNFDKSEFLLCRKEIGTNMYAEVKIQKQLLISSAKTANEFISMVAVLCLVLSVAWIIIFAKRFSQPLSQMNEITRDMADLKFDRTITVNRSDEIGQLAASVNEMSKSLSAALDGLKKSNEKLRDEIELERQLDKMRKTFVANVSHELKTPISIIGGYAEGLKLNVNGDKRDFYCDTIIDESRRMNDLVLGILKLSKYESGQIPAQFEPFDICDTADVMLKRIFEGADVSAENLIDQKTFVLGDKSQIEQVLKAYLENAKSHTEAGGKITVFANDGNDGYKKLRISVHNTGSHVDENIMPYIWQSFYRGDNSHKRDNSRFGLGLSIVSAVMNIHRNKCGVYNTDDGVTFWFELDKAQKQA